MSDSDTTTIDAEADTTIDTEAIDTEAEELTAVNGDNSEPPNYVVRLVLPVSADSPADAFDEVMYLMSRYGVRNWLWSALELESDERYWFVDGQAHTHAEFDAAMEAGDVDAD